MDRLQKKCLIASAGMHSFLFLLVVFGAAFFVPRDKSLSAPPLRAVPTRLIDEALSGGGGSPKVAPSDAQQKGETLVPQPTESLPRPRPIKPPPKEVHKAEPKHEIEKVERPKVKPPKDQPKDAVKPPPTPVKPAKIPPIEL